MLHQKRHPSSIVLEQAFRKHATLVYRFIYHRVGNREDAEDLTGAVFLKAAQWLDGERPPEQIQAWLYATARSVLVEYWQQAQGSTLDVADVEEILFQNEPDVVGREASEQRVAALLNHLSARARAVLTLRFLRGYSLVETAAELGITESNVKVIQHRALKQAATREEWTHER